jgi:PKD domain/FG-GAP-like repeat/FG-GAP repeat
MRSRIAVFFATVGLVAFVPGWSGVARASIAGLSNVAVTSPVNEGGVAHLTGSIDTACNSTSLQVNWGDGTPAENFSEPGAGTFDETHTYADDDPSGTTQDAYSIGLTLSSQQAGCGGDDTGSTRVVVKNVAPSITGATLTSPVGVGDTTTLSGTFTDPGDDTFTLTIDWGDGGSDQSSLPAGSTGFGGTHEYSNAGTFPVVVTLTDDDTGADSTQLSQDVLGVQSFLVTGAGNGAGPHVKAFDGTDPTNVLQSFSAFAPQFTGGVRVAVGDVNGDGLGDIVTAPGPGRSPTVKIWDGKDGSLMDSFSAFSRTFQGGVFVAAGDVNGDHFADVVVGADAGAGPHVKVFDRHDQTLLSSFYAFAPQFTGGVRVAAGDVNGDGYADVVTGAGPGGGPHVKAFSGKDGSVLDSFFAYAPQFTGGVFVAAGDVNGDPQGLADIVTGADKGGGPHVKVFDGGNVGNLLQSFYAFAPQFTGGVRVAAGDVNGDGLADVVAAAGPGAGPHVKVFDSAPAGGTLASFFAYNAGFTGGVYVAYGLSLVQAPGP